MSFRLQPRHLIPALLIQLWGCSTTTNEPPIYITPQTNNALQAYFAQVGSVGSGAFAVSPDGRYSFYSYCLDSSCGSISMLQDALQHCKGMAGTKCVILANGSSTAHPYKVGRPGTAEKAPPLKDKEIVASNPWDL